MKEKIETLQKEMIDAHNALEDFKKKNSSRFDDSIIEFNITKENYVEYDSLVKKVNDSIIKLETAKKSI
jgi:hypothetical protein